MERNNSQKDPRPAAPEARAKARGLRSRHPESLDAPITNIDGAGRARPVPAHPSLHEIAARAHEIYLARGAAPGGELDDWLQAERELCFPGLRE